jgi:hypothetical protein
VVLVRFEGANDGADDLVREKVLSSDLDDARRAAALAARIEEKSRSFVIRTKPCSFAHARIPTSGAVAAPMVDQWTASNP